MKQGWDDDTVKEVALGFIRSRRQIHKFERYCKQLADEENAQMEEDVCTACGGTGQMGGAICAHCEEEDDEAHAEDVWEEDEDIARDRRKYPEEADFE